MALIGLTGALRNERSSAPRPNFYPVDYSRLFGESSRREQALALFPIFPNLVTDAWIASTVQALSEHLVTFDRDFRRLLSSRDVTVLTLKTG